MSKTKTWTVRVFREGGFRWAAVVVEGRAGAECFRAESIGDHFHAHAAALDWAMARVREEGGRVVSDFSSYWNGEVSHATRREAEETTVVVTSPVG